MKQRAMLALFMIFLTLALPVGGADSLPTAIPVKPPATFQGSINDYSWNSFIALNWPALLDSKGRPVRDDAFPNGKPDLSRAFADRGPRVWEGLKADHELFRHGGAEPTVWSEYDDDLPCRAGAVDDGSGEKVLTLLSEGTSMQSGVNQAMAGPLIDRFGRYVHYEVRHNKSYFDFVRAKKYYLRANLPATRMVQLPISVFDKDDPSKNRYGSLEIKAAWRVLNESEDEAAANRYYWTWALIPDPNTGKCGSPQRVALVGMHIIQKVQGFNSWLWATFEHVDNVPCAYEGGDCPPAPAAYSFNAKNPDLDAKAAGNRGFWPARSWRPVDPKALPLEPVKVDDRINAVRVTPVRNSAVLSNSRAHALDGIHGTFWENYILIDVQWPLRGTETVTPRDPAKPPTTNDYVTGALNPEPGPGEISSTNVPVANVTMETFYQKENPSLPSLGASCMQCHYAASRRDFSWTLANRAYPPKKNEKPEE
jgi:hypothetical protein